MATSRREFVEVSQIMNREIVSAAPDDSVEQVVKLLRRQGIRHLLVMQKGRLAGIVSDRDVKRALDPAKTKKRLMNVGGLYFLLEPIVVEEIMTRNPVTIGPETSVHHAAWIMVEKRFGALPVVKNGKVVGIVTETDLLRYFAEMVSEATPEGAARAKRSRATSKRSS